MSEPARNVRELVNKVLEDDPRGFVDALEELHGEQLEYLRAENARLRQQVEAATMGLQQIRDYTGELDPEAHAVEDVALGAYFLARDTLAAIGSDPEWQRAADEQAAKDAAYRATATAEVGRGERDE